MAWAWAGFAVGACRPPEPTPTQNADLGTDNDNLLPTPAAWHDKSIAKGQAEWKPFRKPGNAATADAAGGATGEGATDSASAEGAVEKEIRELVDEYNGLVKDGKYKEALDFLTDDQAAIMEKAIEVLPAFDRKLKEIATAVPGTAESVAGFSKRLSLSWHFALAVKDIKANGTSEGVGTLFDPDAPADGPVEEVHFHKGTEGDSFIEAPHFAALARILSKFQTAMEEFDLFLAAVKSGSLSGAALDQKVAEINGLLVRWAGLGETPSPDDAKPTDADAEEPNAEPPPEDPPPKPKKKPAPGG
jgi:hypothetical protein